ncbi:MAG: hypothetical protein COT16_03190 [Elusimicrobia bacterium CG08_land_8_20_14_0_20_44_26]|nr:MAG: hypothetical protein COT16_03190 [Elusimicrobia bacterium CG08_land_8_20_14_0_20_44_26]
MKFSELDFNIQHVLNRIFSPTGLTAGITEFLDSRNLSSSDWELVSKTLENIENEKLNIIIESLLGRVVFGDIPAGGGGTETLLRAALLKILAGCAPQEVLFLVSFENQTQEIKNKMLELTPSKKSEIERINFSTASMFLENVLKEKAEDQSLLVRLGMAENFSYSSRWMELLAEERNGVNMSVYFWMVLHRKLTGSLTSVPEELREDTEEVFRSYEVSLENRCLFDRVGMCNLIRRFYDFDKEFLIKHFAKFSAIFVDNGERYLPGEWPILRIFSKNGVLAVCGDFSISFYTPKDVQLGVEFRTFTLSNTFRHSPSVIECLSNLSGRNIVSQNSVSDTGFVYYEAKDVQDELEFIAFEIKQLILRGMGASKIGIIYSSGDFPVKFSQPALKSGIDCLEYPSSDSIIPLAEKLLEIIEKNPGASTMEILRKNLSAAEVLRVSAWFERHLRKFGPYEAISRRNNVILEDIRKLKERAPFSVKIVAEYFANAYQFDAVFLPDFEEGTYTGNMKSIFYKVTSRAASCVFITRPLVREALYYWQKPFEPSPSKLVAFFPSGASKGSDRGPVKRLLKKLF